MLVTSLRRAALSGGGLPRAAALRRLSDAIVVPGAGPKAVAEETVKVEDRETLARFTGAPVKQMETRTIKIYQPSPTVMGGTQNTLSWKVQWEDQHTQRWTNPLMGWTSTNDPLSNTHMTMDFNTKEDAVRWAQSNGWSYTVVEMTHENRTLTASGPKKYADNFKWKGGKGHRKFPALYEPPPPPPAK